MRARLIWLWSALFCLAALLLPAAPALADPVDLLLADTQAFVQDDGAMDIIYRLTFRENEGRRTIKKIGELYTPVHFTRGWLRHGSESSSATATSLGGGYYRISLGDSTESGETYVLELHFRSRYRFADPTEHDGKQLLAVWFNPTRWSLPIARSVIKLVLPLALPDTVEKHEDITPEMVDALGVVTEQRVIDEQHKWAFVYTDYHGQRRLTVYAERRSLPRQGTHLVRLYVPQSAMPHLAAHKRIGGSGSVSVRLVSKGHAELVSERYLLQQHISQPVGVTAELGFEEHGSRNFLPRPPIEVTDHQFWDASCVALRLDDEKIGCSTSTKALVFDKPSKAGQRLELQVRLTGRRNDTPTLTVRRSTAYLPLGLLFLAGMGGQLRRAVIGGIALVLGALLIGVGRGLYRRADASSPEQLRAEIMALARSRSGEISAADVQATLGRRAEAAAAVLRELGHEGVCVEQQKGGAAYYLFADLQPRLLIRRCEYCQAELPLGGGLTECPRCGGSFKEAVERRALSEEGLYRMDE